MRTKSIFKVGVIHQSKILKGKRVMHRADLILIGSVKDKRKSLSLLDQKDFHLLIKDREPLVMGEHKSPQLAKEVCRHEIAHVIVNNRIDYEDMIVIDDENLINKKLVKSLMKYHFDNN